MQQAPRRICLVIFGLVFQLLTGITLADTSSALAELEKVEALSFGGIGVAGTRSPGDKLFRELAAAPEKTALFHTLWEKGNNQAKCYALIGLYWVRDPDADRLAEQLVLSRASVATIRGCIVGTHEQVATFVDFIKSGDYLKYYFPDLAASH
jgi:hypothetical protein